MPATILEHYYNQSDTFVSISEFCKAVSTLLGVTVDPKDDISIKAFFEAYDTLKFTDLEYDLAMRHVSRRHEKPSYDLLESFRPSAPN
jgi:hypothetical protein